MYFILDLSQKLTVGWKIPGRAVLHTELKPESFNGKFQGMRYFILDLSWKTQDGKFQDMTYFKTGFKPETQDGKFQDMPEAGKLGTESAKT